MLGWYGFTEEHKEVHNELVKMTKGSSLKNWEQGEKLSHVVQYYFLTKDSKLLETNMDTYIAYLSDMKTQMESDPNGLLEKQRYSGDISDYDYNSHH